MLGKAGDIPIGSKTLSENLLLQSKEGFLSSLFFKKRYNLGEEDLSYDTTGDTITRQKYGLAPLKIGDIHLHNILEKLGYIQMSDLIGDGIAYDDNGEGVEKVSYKGFFGKKTLKAVKKFQKDLGIDTDGVVGRETKSAMYQFLYRHIIRRESISEILKDVKKHSRNGHEAAKYVNIKDIVYSSKQSMIGSGKSDKLSFSNTVNKSMKGNQLYPERIDVDISSRDKNKSGTDADEIIQVTLSDGRINEEDKKEIQKLKRFFEGEKRGQLDNTKSALGKMFQGMLKDGYTVDGDMDNLKFILKTANYKFDLKKIPGGYTLGRVFSVAIVDGNLVVYKENNDRLGYLPKSGGEFEVQPGGGFGLGDDYLGNNNKFTKNHETQVYKAIREDVADRRERIISVKEKRVSELGRSNTNLKKNLTLIAKELRIDNLLRGKTNISKIIRQINAKIITFQKEISTEKGISKNTSTSILTITKILGIEGVTERNLRSTNGALKVTGQIQDKIQGLKKDTKESKLQRDRDIADKKTEKLEGDILKLRKTVGLLQSIIGELRSEKVEGGKKLKGLINSMEAILEASQLSKENYETLLKDIGALQKVILGSSTTNPTFKDLRKVLSLARGMIEKQIRENNFPQKNPAQKTESQNEKVPKRTMDARKAIDAFIQENTLEIDSIGHAAEIIQEVELLDNSILWLGNNHKDMVRIGIITAKATEARKFINDHKASSEEIQTLVKPQVQKAQKIQPTDNQEVQDTDTSTILSVAKNKVEEVKIPSEKNKKVPQKEEMVEKASFDIHGTRINLRHSWSSKSLSELSWAEKPTREGVLTLLKAYINDPQLKVYEKRSYTKFWKGKKGFQTAFAVQVGLASLGGKYNPQSIDGVWGNNSRRALNALGYGKKPGPKSITALIKKLS